MIWDTDGNPVAPRSVGGIIGDLHAVRNSLIYMVGEPRHSPPPSLNCLATPGYVSSKKVVSSRESEAKSLFEGDLKQTSSKAESSSGSISFCHLTSGLNWRGLAFVQSTLDAKREGIWKPAKRERLSSFVPTDTTSIDRGLYLYLNIVVCLQVLCIGPFFLPFSWHLS